MTYIGNRPAGWRRVAKGVAGIAILGMFTFLGPVRAIAQAAPAAVPVTGVISHHVALVPNAFGEDGNGGSLPTTDFLPVSGSAYAPTFTDVSLDSIQNNATSPLANYDTVVLVQVDNIATYLANATFKSRLESFVSNGGKLIIWDSEANPDYSAFPYPFQSDNPGATGTSGGTLTIAEENTLASSSSSSPSYVNTSEIAAGTDAVGDANVMTSYDPHWYVSMTAKNVNNVTGPVQTYARYGTGLIIWNGLDMDYIANPSNFDPASTDGSVQLSRIWMLDLQQRWNPDNLPSGLKVFGVALTPQTQQLAVHTVVKETATLSKAAVGVPNSPLTFKVISGPNAGLTKTVTTDSHGNAVFTWTSQLTGTDKLQVSGTLTDAQNKSVVVTDTATVVWIGTAPGGSEGYRLAASDGGVFAFSAPFYGSLGNVRLNQPIVGMATDPATGGYWLVASDGGVFSFNAPFYGSTGGVSLNKPVVGMAIDWATGGYWLVASDGGVFSFNARFYGSTGGVTLNKPVVGMASNLAGSGYWLVASDGGIFAFNVPFYGSTGGVTLNKPVVGMASDLATGGYRMVASDGGVFAFHAPFLGSTGGINLVKPIVGMANSSY